MRPFPRLGGVLGALALAAPAWAELPDYTPQLQARTNLRGNASGAYNVEPGNLLAGSLQVPLTLDRQVAFRLSITPEGRSAVWWGGDGMGRRLYLLPDLGEDARTGDPGLNSRGDIAFAVTGAIRAADNGVYLLNAATPDPVRVIREPTGASDWSSLWLNEVGQLGARVTFSGVGKAYALLTPQGAGYVATLVAKEKGVDAESPFEFLYSPTLNDLGEIAGVGDTRAPGTGFQELRVFSADGTSRVIARTRDLDAASPIYRFASVQPALNNHGQVAFLATVRDASERNIVTVFLWTGRELRIVAQGGQGGIRDVEFFPADLSDGGLVVFRAFDSNGLRAVWVGDGVELKRVVSEHDILPSDLGPARVDQETPSNPVFAGGPLINARGDITFAAGLAPPDNDQVEWGTAIYVAQSSLPPPGGSDGGTDGGTDGGPGEDGGADGGRGEDGGVDGGPGEDGGVDGGPGEDGGTDAGPGEDGGTDGGPGEDGGTDGGPGEDGGADGGPGEDGGADGGPGEDGGTDGGPGEDGGTDAGAGEDAGADAGSGGDGGTDAGAGEDAGADAGTQEPDAGPVTDAGTGQPPDAGNGNPGEDNGGCGCQSTQASAFMPWLLLGLARFASARRRGSRRD
ncbi:MXAN_5453 family MXYO-CTERM-anchored protein [Pyxidicoccus xibeiensis]|uniref:MXAN_5453 family MXYO-CTERM-anchored protein n=1 Tax=Pyxidicoccus xibeiensis TaxID=2906759 RepID=UPI0020A6F733|nr:MXAN_5453 family MXYO-CTERM-anchored protein [Pyxidicoccus xibeiensis]MCP3137104.1 MYXO-CTERM sorting domain-containing protein [Pyxidicoccus xibeiensis]